VATVELQESKLEVSMDSISRYWFGDYLAMWRPRAPGARALSAGMQGEAVLWLRHSLNSIQGRPKEESASDYYDEDLVQMVEDFQRQHRLNVDGVAGAQTQILIDALSNPAGAPLLVAQAANAGASS
jgi:general secretion pathway protein A